MTTNNVTDRLQTTREHALTLLRAAWPNVEEREESDDTGTRITFTINGVMFMRVSERTVNKAWSVAMDRARNSIKASLPAVNQRIAIAEMEVDALRKQRRRIIDTLNGFETEATK